MHEALTGGRYWREIPIEVMWRESAILEGAVDLVFADSDGLLHVIDYKTDRIRESQLATRAAEHRAQGEAYATTLERVTGRHVCTIHFVFASLNRAVSLPRNVGHPD